MRHVSPCFFVTKYHFQQTNINSITYTIKKPKNANSDIYAQQKIYNKKTKKHKSGICTTKHNMQQKVIQKICKIKIESQ